MENKKEELEALKNRVRLGNEKLNVAFEQIKKIAHNSEQWNFEMERWHQASKKLSGLCSQLKLMDFRDCLYLDDNGKKTKSCLEGGECWCCPSNINYWESELMSLPGPKARQTKGGEEQAEFLRKLGGENGILD